MLSRLLLILMCCGLDCMCFSMFRLVVGCISGFVMYVGVVCRMFRWFCMFCGICIWLFDVLDSKLVCCDGSMFICDRVFLVYVVFK